MNQFIQAKNAEFRKAVDFFKKEIASIRTGRANPNILEGVTVESYGTRTPLNGVASISVPDGQSIVLAPWDKSVVKEIEKAVVEADLGLGVVNEGERIRLTVPKMTEENRRELVKKLNDKLEDARVTIRGVREEVKNAIEAAETAKQIAEDDRFRFVKELDEAVAGYNEELKEIRDRKEKEVMTV